jgi:hypothetical protein
MFYADLELLEAAVNRNDPLAHWYLDKAREHERPAMQVIEGYCNARWRPLIGHGPGPLRAGGWGGSLISPQSEEAITNLADAGEGAQEATEAPEEEPRRGFFSRLFGG